MTSALVFISEGSVAAITSAHQASSPPTLPHPPPCISITHRLWGNPPFISIVPFHFCHLLHRISISIFLQHPSPSLIPQSPCRQILPQLPRPPKTPLNKLLQRARTASPPSQKTLKLQPSKRMMPCSASQLHSWRIVNSHFPDSSVPRKLLKLMPARLCHMYALTRKPPPSTPSTHATLEHRILHQDPRPSATSRICLPDMQSRSRKARR